MHTDRYFYLACAALFPAIDKEEMLGNTSKVLRFVMLLCAHLFPTRDSR